MKPFTREDVDRLRAIQFDSTWGPWYPEELEKRFGGNLDDANKWADDLASRIEALLPPRQS